MSYTSFSRGQPDPRFNLGTSNSPHSRFSSQHLKTPIKARTNPADRDPNYGLTLKKLIGTTTCSNTGLATHTESRSIAICAGAAVCIIQLDEKLQITQQHFLRARPNAVAINGNGSPMPTTPSRQIDGRDKGTPVGLASPLAYESPGRGGTEDAGKTWSARERVKAATTVSFSPDGQFLAVGEVCVYLVKKNVCWLC